jgi:hypothetical protein
MVKSNIFLLPLPFDITANDKTSKFTIPAEGIVVNSVSPLQADTGGFYF